MFLRYVFVPDKQEMILTLWVLHLGETRKNKFFVPKSCLCGLHGSTCFAQFSWDFLIVPQTKMSDAADT